jgi:hypothetical protein
MTRNHYWWLADFSFFNRLYSMSRITQAWISHDHYNSVQLFSLDAVPVLWRYFLTHFPFSGGASPAALPIYLVIPTKLSSLSWRCSPCCFILWRCFHAAFPFFGDALLVLFYGLFSQCLSYSLVILSLYPSHPLAGLSGCFFHTMLALLAVSRAIRKICAFRLGECMTHDYNQWVADSSAAHQIYSCLIHDLCRNFTWPFQLCGSTLLKLFP